MAQLELPISNQVTNPIPVDYYYGPYASVAAANTAVPEVLRLCTGPDGTSSVGRTVGINLAGVEVEYWWAGGTADANLVPKAAGSTDPVPPTADPVLRLLTGGEYIPDPDYTDDTFHYLMLASTWVAADGSDKAIDDTPYVIVPANPGMSRLDVPCLAPGGMGTVVVVSGPESDTVLTYPTIPSGYIARQSIFVSETESYPYPYNIPTKNRDGITGEVRNNSATFASIDNLETLHGTTIRERFDIDYSLIADSDTVTKEEGIDDATGEPRIILHAAPGTGDIFITLPNANYIYVSTTGNDSTGRRGDISRPFATLDAAQGVYTAGDVIYVNPGVYTGQTTLELVGLTVQYELPVGADISFSGYVINATSGSVIVRGKGILRGSLVYFSNTSGIIDIEFDSIILTGGFWIQGSSRARTVGRVVTTPEFFAVQFTPLGYVEIETVTITSTDGNGAYFRDNTDITIEKTRIISATGLLQFYQGSSPYTTYSTYQINNCRLDAPIATNNGTGTQNSFYGRIWFKNTKINSTLNGILFKKLEVGSEFWFDGVDIKAGSGYHSMDALMSANFQTTGIAPQIRVLSGGLTLNTDVVYDATRVITNLEPYTAATRSDLTPTPFIGALTSIKNTGEPVFATAKGTAGQVPVYNTDGTTTPATVTSGGSALTVKDEGTNLSTAATSLNFVGPGVTATNTGAAITVTIPGTSVTVDSVPTNGSTNPVQSDGVFDALALKVDKETYTTIAIATSTYTLTAASKQNPLFQSVATGAFTIALSGVVAGQHGEWVITVNTASSVVVTMPTAFTNRQFGEVMAATYTLPAGVNGRIVILYYSTTNGTALDWVFADANIQTQINLKLDNTDTRLSDSRYHKRLGETTVAASVTGTTAKTLLASFGIPVGSVLEARIYNVYALITSTQANTKTYFVEVTDGTTTATLGTNSFTNIAQSLLYWFTVSAGATTIVSSAGQVSLNPAVAWTVKVSVTQGTSGDTTTLRGAYYDYN